LFLLQTAYLLGFENDQNIIYLVSDGNQGQGGMGSGSNEDPGDMGRFWSRHDEYGTDKRDG
jgi:hypothetical protein